jgi:hypothetical protein
MSSSFEKSVKGGTKVKLAPPKSKYVEHILLATQSGEAGVAEVFRTLTHRLRDATWTVAFKSLLIVHLMIKEGTPDVTLSYLSAAPTHRLAINSFTDVQTQGHNIRRYSEYLLARAKAYAAGRTDYVAQGQRHMKGLNVDKGLLRETEIVQDQVRQLVKCNLLDNDVENEISLMAFRLLTRDLLDLYNAENEAMMNVLSHYFEMSRPDAERSIRIYKTFCKQTDQVVQFLSVARTFEHATRLEIPKIKHAPTSLAASLQEYLDDKDFDAHRRQYVAEQEAKKTGKPFSKPVEKTTQPTAGTSAPKSTSSAAPVLPPIAQSRGPAPDLIDFFDSIEQNQQPMAQSVPQAQQQQPSGFMPQQQTGFGQAHQIYQQPLPANGFAGNTQGTNPFGQPQMPQQQQQQPQMQPVQTDFTGAGFGGYGPQPQQAFAGDGAFGQVQQQAFGSPPGQQPFAPPTQPPAQQLQPQSTNPFRQSVMATGGSMGTPISPDATGGLQRQGTNPFARNAPANALVQQQQAIPEEGAVQNFQQSTPAYSTQQMQPQQIAFQPIQSQPTGTNPFARAQPVQSQPTATALQPQATGTNPFRQSAFVNQQTGQGWQSQQQATMGGLEHLETVPVFPRPGQAVPQQQQQSPWG